MPTQTQKRLYMIGFGPTNKKEKAKAKDNEAWNLGIKDQKLTAS